MINTCRNIFLRLFAVFMLAFMMFACANIGNPNGGPYDGDPPKFIGSKPTVNQLNFKGKTIEVYFDEYVSVDKPSENVIITPPQKQNPIITALGKKISVQLRDSLKESTTYTIDFTSSISDNNEKNVLENFSIAFSTGDVLDTLCISGVLVNAEDLEPMQRVLVGIHENLSDTAFTTTPFLRTSKTDDRGWFTIRNIAPGSYYVFALEDKNRNYIYDKSNNEAIAFLDSIIIPMSERAMVSDTIWRDSITVDTVMLVERTLFYPNDLNLWLFTDSVMPRQRMLRPDRPQDYIFTLSFNAALDTFPKPVPLNFEPADSLWYVAQKGKGSEGSFAVNYWILDSMIYNIDTLAIEVSYWKSNDTVPGLMDLQTDTLNLVNRDAAKRKKEDTKLKKPVNIRKADGDSSDAPAEPEQPPVVPLQVNISPSGSINPYDVITVIFSEPVMDVRKEFFVMELVVDTLREAVDFEFEEDSTQAMTYLIKCQFKYNEKYRISIDSGMLCGVYGHSNNFLSVDVAVKESREYGNLILNIRGLPLEGDSGRVIPAFVELLNSNDVPVRKVIVEDEVAKFMNIPPEKYYARIILDTNGNGIWDAGNYEERRQPEKVIYYMEQTEMRQNHTFDNTWDINSSAPGEKPFELLKNKPKEPVNKNRDYKEESKPRNRNSTSPNMRGLGGL